MIKGFDAAVANMEVGQVVDVHLMPEEAYGMPNPYAIFTLEIAQLPGSEDLTVGQQVYLSNPVSYTHLKGTARPRIRETYRKSQQKSGTLFHAGSL